MTNIQTTTLPNGLRIVTDTMSDISSVTVGVWVEKGGRHESRETHGITHFIEHMLFKGTTTRSARMITEQIEDVGGHINAYTSREHTTYYARLLGKDLNLAVTLLGDMLQNAVFSEEDLTRECMVILQEIYQSYDTPDDIIFDHFQTTAYPHQSLGRPIAGTIESVRKLDRDLLKQYLQSNYTNESMVLAAAGQVCHEDFVEQVRGSFTQTAGNATPSKGDVAGYQGGFYQESRDLQQVHFLVGFEAVGIHDPFLYPLMSLSALLGGGMSSRLFQEVREAKGLVYSIYSFLQTYQDSGVLGIYAGTSQKDLQELVDVLCEQLLTIEKTLHHQEVQRACTQLKAAFLLSLERSQVRCERLGQNMLHFGRIIPVSETISKINAVTKEDIQRVIRHILKSKPTIALIGPLDSVDTSYIQKNLESLRA